MILFASAVCASPAVSSAEAATISEGKEVDVSLSVNVSGKIVEATLVFLNRGTTDVFIDRWNACLKEGGIKNDVFKISYSGGTLKYIGTLAKRQLSPEDSVRLGPGERITAKVRLDQAYAFPPGRHEYRAKYAAYHQSTNVEQILELKSNDAKFSAF
jgi:hypothetical protein